MGMIVCIYVVLGMCGVHMCGRKLAMRELWTGEPSNIEKKLTREREMHDKKETKTYSHLGRFVDLILFHLPW